MAEIFFKDKAKLFECRVFVEGASIEDTSARLVLKFPDQNVNRIYYGKIDENNNFSVEIPALKEIKDSKGTAILEVIAESTFFESWTGDIELKQSKSVKVEMISKENKKPLNEAPKIVVEIKESKPPFPVEPNKVAEEKLADANKKGLGKVVKEKEVIKEVKLSPKQQLVEMFRTKEISKEDLKNYFPSYTATLITEHYKGKELKEDEKIQFQYFLDRISPSKLRKLKKLILGN